MALGKFSVHMFTFSNILMSIYNTSILRTFIDIASTQSQTVMAAEHIILAVERIICNKTRRRELLDLLIQETIVFDIINCVQKAILEESSVQKGGKNVKNALQFQG